MPPLSYNAFERLALEIMKEYGIWLGMTQVITSQQRIYKNRQKCEFCTGMQ